MRAEALFPAPSGAAAIIDVETTGMDSKLDRVIELAVVVFEYGMESGQVGPIVGRYVGLEDPGRPIPPEATNVHHITDAMVRGKRIDDRAVKSVLSDVGLVIAHNARFDRPFLEARLSVFAGFPWACSIQDVGWKDCGFASSALEFLAFKAGLFYEGHRAQVDCLAVLAVLDQPLVGTLGSALRKLLESARLPSYRVTALDSPYETKDVLKARGYRWDPEKKVWAGEVDSAGREAETQWLREAVYGESQATVEIEKMTAKERYAGRAGIVERVRV